MLSGEPLKLSTGPDPARQRQPNPAGARPLNRLDAVRAANRDRRAARGRPIIAVDVDDAQERVDGAEGQNRQGTAAADRNQGEADAADNASDDGSDDSGEHTRADYDASRKAIPQADGSCCRRRCRLGAPLCWACSCPPPSVPAGDASVSLAPLDGRACCVPRMGNSWLLFLGPNCTRVTNPRVEVDSLLCLGFASLRSVAPHTGASRVCRVNAARNGNATLTAADHTHTRALKSPRPQPPSQPHLIVSVIAI